MKSIATRAKRTRDLPDGIVFEILLRLPVTSLSRFKCVCKNWYHVIESRDFREQHFALQNNSALFIVVNRSDATPYLEGKICSGKSLRVVESISSPVFTVRTVGPCRGLFLVVNGPKEGGRLGLLNPATNAFRLLPTPMMPNNISISDYDTYDFSTYGLGWCPITDDYKVVCFIYHRQVALVYTLSSDSWRLIDSPIPNLDRMLLILNNYRWNLHTNGFCYWVPIPFQEPRLQEEPRLLVSFDVAREIFMTISLPPNVVNKAFSLTSYYDSLALLASKEGDVEVWILQQERQQHFWTKNFNFTLKGTIPCGIWNNTHILLLKRMSYPPVSKADEVLAYDMNNLEDGVIDINRVEKVMDNSILGFLNYKKTMLSIKGGSTNWIASESYKHINDFFN